MTESRYKLPPKHTLMKTIHFSPQGKRIAPDRVSTKPITTGLALICALALPQGGANAAVLLGGATDFAVLAGAGITIAAPVDSTHITGNIGSYSTTTITGLENLVLDGLNHAGNAITQQGKIDLGIAYGDVATRPATDLFPAIHDIGGLTLSPGVYNAPTSLGITGVLTLDAEGDPNAVWIFQMGSTLTTATGSNVELINGARAGNIFWQVGSSATLGVGSHFEGTIMAQDSISANTDATFIGRLLAMDGAVTLDNNNIVIPEPGSAMLVAFGLAIATLKRRRKC